MERINFPQISEGVLTTFNGKPIYRPLIKRRFHQEIFAWRHFSSN